MVEVSISLFMSCRVLVDSSDVSVTQHLMWRMKKSCIKANDEYIHSCKKVFISHLSTSTQPLIVLTNVGRKSMIFHVVTSWPPCIIDFTQTLLIVLYIHIIYIHNFLQ